MPTQDSIDTSQPDELNCEQIPALARVYLARELDKDSTLELRAHLARCAECMEQYRGSVATASSLSRMTSEEREKRMLERQRAARHAAAFGLTEASRPKRRHFRLRMVLIPAVFIYIFMQLANLGPPPGKVLIVDAARGVSIDGREIDLATHSGLVLPGRWVLTDRFAHAALDAGDCTLNLGASTDLLVESARPLRFRFRSGNLNLVGSASFVTVLGIVTVEEGRGSLLLDDHGLHIEPESGAWVLVDKRGKHELEPGRSQSFGMQL